MYKSVDVTPIAEHDHLLLMRWKKQVDLKDVAPAFEIITAYLEQAERPMYIVVDITSSPQFPLVETARHALSGPHRHPNMGGWLVIGTSPLARMIEHTLLRFSKKRNIFWFKSMAEVHDYLNGQIDQPA